MPPSEPVATATLEFDAAKLLIRGETDLRLGLSGVAMAGDTLWVACDEGCQIERLSRRGPGSTFTNHETFPLAALLTLPAAPSEEADIEGLDVDGSFLWLIGSHSQKRKKPKNTDTAAEVSDKLRKVTRDGNRHLLARIPLEGTRLGREQAATLPATATSSELLDEIRGPAPERADPHLSPFVALPGKDNGFDIEGLAVRGRRAFVGLRSPVLREWCCVLELELADDGRALHLATLAGGRRYRKHFLRLNGLGVRDLVIDDDDLLILAGPPMAHDGPHEIWRWTRGAKPGATPAAGDITRVLQLRQREASDRAEAFVVFDQAPSGTSVLVLFDTPSAERLPDERSVLADIYHL